MDPMHGATGLKQVQLSELSESVRNKVGCTFNILLVSLVQEYYYYYSRIFPVVRAQHCNYATLLAGKFKNNMGYHDRELVAAAIMS